MCTHKSQSDRHRTYMQNRENKLMTIHIKKAELLQGFLMNSQSIMSYSYDIHMYNISIQYNGYD